MSDQHRREQNSAALDFSFEHIHTCCCGGHGFVRVDRPVGHILFGVPIPCICQRDEQARRRAERLRATSGISETEMQEWQFTTFHPELCQSVNGDRPQVVQRMAGIKGSCQEYAARPDGWLILQGPPGTGKTHLAYAIAGECLRKGRPAFAHTVPDILQLLRNAYDDEGMFDKALDDLKNVDLLVLDDLGAQRDTSWAMETLYQILNYRYARRLGLVVTTNLDLANATDEIEPRLLSRLREGTQAERGWVRLLSLPCVDFRPYRVGR